MKITPSVLLAIAPNANRNLVGQLCPALNHWLVAYEMTDKAVVAQALGQWAEETDGFKTLVEYGSLAYFNRYDGRMGNLHKGDGYKFRGRGVDMHTGYDEYLRESKELGIDLVNHPDLLQVADIAVHAGCQYWKDHGLVPLAKAGQFRTITIRINGGTNGIAVRRTYVARAEKAITSDLDRIPLGVPVIVKPLASTAPPPPIQGPVVAVAKRVAVPVVLHPAGPHPVAVGPVVALEPRPAPPSPPVHGRFIAWLERLAYPKAA